MKYDKMILEMLERIQTLEGEIKALKETQASVSPKTVATPLPVRYEVTPRRTNTKVTDEMMEACYQAGKQAIASDYADVVAMAKQVHLKTGMNQNNALMTIFAVVALLNGELYKRAISGKATKIYFQHILRDYGKGGLQRAIAAMRMHIDYRRAFHHNVDLLERICDQYQDMIDGK